MPNIVRDTVLGWDENSFPTKDEIYSALLWWSISHGNPRNDSGKTERLLRRIAPDPPLFSPLVPDRK